MMKIKQLYCSLYAVGRRFVIGVIPVILGTSISSAALAAPAQVRLYDIGVSRAGAPQPGPLVPMTLISGDREFDGHGPDITSRVKLEVVPDGSQIIAKVYFHAKETTHDWSEVEETFSIPVFRANPGQRVTRINGPTEAQVQFRSQPGGFQIGFPGEDWTRLIDAIAQLFTTVCSGTNSDCRLPDDFPCHRILECRDLAKRAELSWRSDNHVHVIAPETPGPVSSFMIVGDTGGPDISDDRNPKDDTRIVAITFNPINVELDPPGVPTAHVLQPPGATSGTGVVTGHLVSNRTGSIERNTDRFGGDYRDFEFDGPAEGCQQFCGAEDNCQAWTYAPIGMWGIKRPHCWLKNKVSSPKSVVGLISGVMGATLGVSSDNTACADALQGRVAWDYQGSTQWSPNNIANLCRNAESSTEPAQCLNRVMHGGVNWGGGTKWALANAINLCAGAQNANARVSCFQNRIQQGVAWSTAINECKR